MEENNVIPFPKQKRDSPPQTAEETMEKIVRNRINYSRSFSEDVMDILYSIFSQDSIDLENDYFANDVELLKDAVISLHLKANGVGYFIQDIAEQMYSETEESIDEFLEDGAE